MTPSGRANAKKLSLSMAFNATIASGLMVLVATVDQGEMDTGGDQEAGDRNSPADQSDVRQKVAFRRPDPSGIPGARRRRWPEPGKPARPE